MSKFKLIMLTFALLISGLAMAALDPQINVVEVSGSDLRAPSHEADQVLVRNCAECKPLKLKVSAKTVYRLAGFKSLPVSLPEFSNNLRNAGEQELVLVYVAYEPASGVVTEMVLEGAGDDAYESDSE